MASAPKKGSQPHKLTQCYLSGHSKIRMYFSCDCGRSGRATEVEKALGELATQIDCWGDIDIHDEATFLAELRGLYSRPRVGGEFVRPCPLGHKPRLPLAELEQGPSICRLGKRG